MLRQPALAAPASRKHDARAARASRARPARAMRATRARVAHETRMQRNNRLTLGWRLHADMCMMHD